MRITGGQWLNQSIAVPTGHGVRPTPDKVRQAIFDSLGPWVSGLSVLELFAGSGTLSFECLSRGAESALAVELSAKHDVQRFLVDHFVEWSINTDDEVDVLVQ